MNHKEYLDDLLRLDGFIYRKATGTPRDLARKLECSESSVYRRIEDLRAFGLTILYDAVRPSYYYADDREPPFRFIIGPNKKD